MSVLRPVQAAHPLHVPRHQVPGRMLGWCCRSTTTSRWSPQATTRQWGTTRRFLCDTCLWMCFMSPGRSCCACICWFKVHVTHLGDCCRLQDMQHLRPPLPAACTCTQHGQIHTHNAHGLQLMGRLLLLLLRVLQVGCPEESQQAPADAHHHRGRVQLCRVQHHAPLCHRGGPTACFTCKNMLADFFACSGQAYAIRRTMRHYNQHAAWSARTNTQGEPKQLVRFPFSQCRLCDVPWCLWLPSSRFHLVACRSTSMSTTRQR
jgi:hypothetical protein